MAGLTVQERLALAVANVEASGLVRRSVIRTGGSASGGRTTGKQLAQREAFAHAKAVKKG